MRFRRTQGVLIGITAVALTVSACGAGKDKFRRRWGQQLEWRQRGPDHRWDDRQGYGARPGRFV